MLNGSEIVSCVTTAVPEAKNAKWRQTDEEVGYFVCELDGKMRSIMVLVNANYVVFSYLASREIAVALDIIKHLRGE